MDNEEQNNIDSQAKITDANLSSTMRNSFLDYAMSVIVARALPDVRDGLKPVHRRIMYSMIEQGITPDKPHKKSARIVGDVMAKYHPHGDTAIYDSMVRMAQDFSYRYMLVDGHGNFGSVDGDAPAAMRYTESRLSKIALEMVRDINKDTIDFEANYDGEEREPVVLPSRFPNLLVNGAQGIAVGMATNIPTHNLGEVISAIHLLMENPDVTVQELMEELPGPDFPTGAIVMGKSGIRKAYETGRGSVTVRSKVEIESDSQSREKIIVHELPYMVNKEKLIKHISELVVDKKVEGISAIRDESDREAGIRIAIDIRREASATVVLNNLYKQTLLQTSFSFNMLAIDHGRPKTMSLKDILFAYVEHQREIIRRRTAFDLKKAQDRAHILEGLRIALDHIDEIISIIRSSQTPEIAKAELIKRYEFSDRQAQAILDMRLVRLTGLERDKVEDEYQKLMVLIKDLKDILANPKRVDEIIYTELREIQDRFGDPRRTELQVGDVTSIEDEDLIDEEDVIVTLTHNGYIKRLAQNEFRSQNRGGRGVQGMDTHDDDFVEQLVSTSTHDTLLFFTDKGKVYKMKGYEIPEYGRTAKGIPVINLLGVESGETVQTVVNIRQDKEDERYLFFATRNGVIKKSPVSEFKNIRNNGLKALTLKEDDSLMTVSVTNGDENIILATHNGFAVSTNEQTVRSMGRSASGVRGIRLREGDYLVGMDILKENQEVLVITENGYGKRTPVVDYPIKGRGGKGFKTVQVTEKNGLLSGLAVVDGSEDIMVTTNQGIMIRFAAQDVSQTGRSTQGVRLIKLEENNKVATLAVLDNVPEEEAIQEETSSESTTSSVNND